MAVTWTTDQRAVIEHRDGSLLVSAAAGSGKTAVLIQHIIDRITDEQRPLDISRLLIVTFTRAAAGEMQKRLRAALQAALEANPENRYLQRQLALLHQANISTIDSFCNLLVRNYFFKLGIEPDLRIADESELRILRKDVLEDMMEQCYEEASEEFFAFMDAFAGNKQDKEVRDLIEEVFLFAQSAPFPEEWFDACADRLRDLSFGSCEWTKELSALIHARIGELLREIEACLAQCEKESGLHLYAEVFESDRRAMERILREKSFLSMVNAIKETVFARKPAKNRIKEAQETAESLSAVRDEIKKAFKQLKDQYTYDEVTESERLQRASRDGLYLLALTKRFSDAYAVARAEKNIADFSDIAHMALSLVVQRTEKGYERTALAQELAGRFDEIIVDEYQDSNLVQELLLTAISGESSGKDNMFMVGDVKQSIYKFRMARPEIFLEKYHRYSYEASLRQKIDLSRNFRSRAGVLDVINRIFRRLMDAPIGGVVYDKNAALYPGATFEGDDPPVRLWLLETTGSADEALEQEARLVALQIERLLADPSALVADKEGGLRPVKKSDIAILLRTYNRRAEVFSQALHLRGIASLVEQKTGYFGTGEIQTMLSALRIIDNPRQDIPLAAVLKSPIGGVSDAQLADMVAFREEQTATDTDPDTAEGRRRKKSGYLYESCRFAAQRDPVRFARVARFLDRLEDYRFRAETMDMRELIEYILEESGYELYLRAMPGADARMANVMMLLERADAFEKTSSRGLHEFNRYIETMQKYELDFGAAVPGEAGADAVRIMSIHKSKGLEFPVVILADMGKQLNLRDTNKPLLLHEELGLAPVSIDTALRLKSSNLWYRYVGGRIKQELLGEELRVLYVAMTRAREHLILSGTTKKAERLREEPLTWDDDAQSSLPSFRIEKAKSYLDWVMAALCGQHQGVCAELFDEESLRSQEIMERHEDYSLKKELQQILETPHGKDYEYFEKSMTYRYPHEALRGLRGVVSVSELKMQAMQETGSVFACVEPVSPDNEAQNMQYQAGGALRGDAYHRLLELIPPEKGDDAEQVRVFMKEVVAGGLMQEKETALINPKDIAIFYGSSLGRRLQAAAAAGKLWREQPFTMGVPAGEVYPEISDEEMILVQGIIDLYFEEDGALVVVDYKTDRVSDAQTLIRRYRKQLELYRDALAAATNMPVGGMVIYSFCLHETIEL